MSRVPPLLHELFSVSDSEEGENVSDGIIFWEVFLIT